MVLKVIQKRTSYSSQPREAKPTILCYASSTRKNLPASSKARVHAPVAEDKIMPLMVVASSLRQVRISKKRSGKVILSITEDVEVTISALFRLPSRVHSFQVHRVHSVVLPKV